MMNRIFLLALGTCALAGNLNAETVWQQIGQAAETEANAASIEAKVALSAEARALRKEAAEAQAAHEAQVRSEQEALAQIAKRWHERQAKFQAGLLSACQQQDLNNQMRYAAFRASINGGQLVDGDPVPEIGNLYDSEPMIKMYLRDSGYTEISDAEITRIHDYMRLNHIRHVSQLAQ